MTNASRYEIPDQPSLVALSSHWLVIFLPQRTQAMPFVPSSFKHETQAAAERLFSRLIYFDARHLRQRLGDWAPPVSCLQDTKHYRATNPTTTGLLGAVENDANPCCSSDREASEAHHECEERTYYVTCMPQAGNLPHQKAH